MMEDQNVFLTLNDSQSMQDGEEMVVIADESMDMNTLQSLLASGAVQTLSNDDEIIQVTESGLMSDTIVQLEGESYHVISDENGQTYLAPTNQTGSSGNLTVTQNLDNSGITYRCPSCPQSYQNANAFTKHMREKHFVKVYTCRQCEQFYETLSQLFLHARRTHVDPKKPKKNPGNYKFHCPDCNYMTNNGGTMEHHRRAHTGVKPFSCDICGKHFAQKANMKTHKNRHIHKDRIFRCETCSKAFNSYDIYLAHLRTREHELREHFQMIASSKLVLGCMGCNNTFDSMFNLNKHTRSCGILKQMDTKFCCKSCDSYFSDIMTLKSHVKSHEGNQIISCPVCGERGFPGFNQLNHHITRAHALKVNRRHVCRYCESTFESKKDLDAHISDMHSEERNARQSRGAVGRLRCRYTNCDFTSNSVMLMDRHHRQHTLQGTNGNYALTLPQSRYSKYNKRRKIREAKKQEDYDDAELLDEEIERVNASLEANEILRYPTLLDDEGDDDDDEDDDDIDEERAADLIDDNVDDEDDEEDVDHRVRGMDVGVAMDDDEDDDDDLRDYHSDLQEHQQQQLGSQRHHEIDEMQQLADSLNLRPENLMPLGTKVELVPPSNSVNKKLQRPVGHDRTISVRSPMASIKSEQHLSSIGNRSPLHGNKHSIGAYTGSTNPGNITTGTGIATGQKSRQRKSPLESAGSGDGIIYQSKLLQSISSTTGLTTGRNIDHSSAVVTGNSAIVTDKQLDITNNNSAGGGVVNASSTVTSGRSRKKPWWYKDYDTTDMAILEDEHGRSHGHNARKTGALATSATVTGAAFAPTMAGVPGNEPLVHGASNDDWHIDM